MSPDIIPSQFQTFGGFSEYLRNQHWLWPREWRLVWYTTGSATPDRAQSGCSNDLFGINYAFWSYTPLQCRWTAIRESTACWYRSTIKYYKAVNSDIVYKIYDQFRTSRTLPVLFLRSYSLTIKKWRCNKFYSTDWDGKPWSSLRQSTLTAVELKCNTIEVLIKFPKFFTQTPITQNLHWLFQCGRGSRLSFVPLMLLPGDLVPVCLTRGRPVARSARWRWREWIHKMLWSRVVQIWLCGMRFTEVKIRSLCRKVKCRNRNYIFFNLKNRWNFR